MTQQEFTEAIADRVAAKVAGHVIRAMRADESQPLTAMARELKTYVENGQLQGVQAIRLLGRECFLAQGVTMKDLGMHRYADWRYRRLWEDLRAGNVITESSGQPAESA